MAECVIKIEHLRKEYPEVTPLKDINAEIYKGDVVALIGPSGTGKSTLLRCINGLETPTSGQINVLGQEICEHSCRKSEAALSVLRQRAGMVFQSFNLFDNLTVFENVCAAPVDLKRVPREEAAKRAMELLRKVGLSAKADSYPSELSGGQKQRVAIARAMAMDPDILLLDEPTSALDPRMVQEVQFLIERLARTGITMIIVTHEMEFAKQISSRVFYMDDGIIYEEGSPEQIFEHPVREKTKSFVERFRKFEIDIVPDDMDMDDILIRLEYFVRNNRLGSAFLTKLHSFMEEAIVINLLEKRKDIEKIEVLLDASQENGSVEAHIRYGGQPYDPMSEAEDASRKIAVHSAEYSYSYASDENHIYALFHG